MTKFAKTARLMMLTTAAALMCTPLQAQTRAVLDNLIQSANLPDAKEKRVDLMSRASKRYAIVIGNDQYAHVAGLANAAADARLVARFLREQGFVTHVHHNVDKQGFERIFRQVLFEVDRDTEVVFYYAGHGIQIGDKNYIFPVDAKLDSTYAVSFEGVSLQNVVSIIGARARAQMVILDSCRDNPFSEKDFLADLSNETRQSRSGFAVQSAPVNTFLAFSTSPGDVAYDGAEGENSPYTGSLVEVAARLPDRNVSSVMEEVRNEVYERTQGQQITWESSTLVSPLTFQATEQAFNVAQLLPASVNTRPEMPISRGLEVLGEENTPSDVIAVTAELDKEIPIGKDLLERLGARGDEEIALLSLPTQGRLYTSPQPGATRGMQTFNLADVNSLVYARTETDIPAVQVAQNGLSDAFVVEIGETAVAVNLEIEPNACDLAAGDYLDPDGVGLARYPNEIDADAAQQACQAAVDRAPDVSRFHYQLGRAYLAQNKPDAARPAFERARALGHTRALYALGTLAVQRAALLEGAARGQVPDDALAYYALGVKEGDPYAMHALGKHFLNNGQTADQQQYGFELLTRSLELGHTFSMNELGTYYLREETPYYDPERALRYLRASADRKDIYGYNNLGRVYRRGLGNIAADPNAALAWYRLAAEGQHPTAPTNIGRMYARGEVNGSKDYAEALKWYDEGLDRGDPWGGANGARLVATQPLGADLASAAERAAKAIALNNVKATRSALEVLAAIPEPEINKAAQRLMGQLGTEVEADGQFGPGSRAALDATAARFGVQPQGSTAPDRLVFLSKLYWLDRKYRIDLF